MLQGGPRIQELNEVLTSIDGFIDAYTGVITSISVVGAHLVGIYSPPFQYSTFIKEFQGLNFQHLLKG